ncbi:MAG: ABC transporter ATP-binding protein [Thermomicrobiales bacterium]
MSGVSLRNISKHFGAVRALDDVSIEVASGELVALLGPSGCGKTTLLRSVAGLEHPTSGEIVIGGVEVSGVPPRKRSIGMVFQSYALFPNMTLRENVGFPLKVRKQPGAQVRARADELLELVGLAEQVDRYPHQVSGGQQQRAALARALAPAPEVLLLDEPLSALDALVRTRLRDEIRRIQKLVAITALYVIHDQAEAMAIADRVAVMNKGRIEQIAQPPELYDAPATRFSAGFVGNRNALELTAANGKVRFGAVSAVPSPAGADGKVICFFRPEDVSVSSNGGGHPAVVENKMFLGSLSRLHLVCDLDGAPARLYADLPSKEALTLEVGAPVSISVRPEHVRLFPMDEDR